MPATYTPFGDPNSSGSISNVIGGIYSTLSSDNGNQIGQDVSQQINSYTVQPWNSANPNANTVNGIAAMFGVTPQQLLAANPFAQNNPNAIYPGQVFQNPNFGMSTNTSLTDTMSGITVNPNGTPPVPKSSTGGATYTPPQGTSSPAPSTSPTPNQYDLSKELQPFVYTPEQQTMLNQFDTYTSQLQSFYSQQDQLFNAELSQINAQMGMQKAAQQKENDAYARGIRQAGLASGMAQITPEIMKAETHQAISDGIQKLTDLSIKQNGLVIDAQKANIEEKMRILDKLEGIQKDKYEIARQMKEDFYTNIKNEEDRIKTVVEDNLPALYTEIKNLPPDQQQAKLAAYAGQLGIPISKMQSYYNDYNEQEQKPITDMRTKLMASAFDIPWSLSDLSLSPEAFQAKLMSSSVVKNNLYAMSLDNQLKLSEINKNNAAATGSAGGGFPVSLSGINGTFVPSVTDSAGVAGYRSALQVSNVLGFLEGEYTRALGEGAKSLLGSQGTNLSYEGAIQKAKSLGITIGKITGASPYWNIYQDEVRSNAGLIAKSIQGQSGNLSDTDIINAIGGFAKTSDIPVLGQEKFNNLADMLEYTLGLYGDIYVID